MNSLKMFTICEICPVRHLKAEKIGVIKSASSLCEILCFFPISQIWSNDIFPSTGTRKGTNMFDGPANLKGPFPTLMQCGRLFLF